MNYKQIVSNRLYVRLSRALSNTTDVNVNYLKIPKNHLGPHAGRVFETTALNRSLSNALMPRRFICAPPCSTLYG